MSDQKKLRTLLIGCGAMGAGHLRSLISHPGFEFAGVVDAVKPNAAKLSAETGVPAFDQFEEALEKLRPGLVVIATDTVSHARLTIQAAQAGVRAVLCEKPMATSLGDARAMMRACEQHGTLLVINHQRRVGADLIEARRLITSGQLGEVRTIRAQCSGDLLGDGTHLVDSCLWLLNDEEPEWVFGQVHRDGNPTRYGHPVTTGAFAVIHWKSGVRAELLCGTDMIEPLTAYQDYLVLGTRGQLWRTGDIVEPNLFLSDQNPGSWAVPFPNIEWPIKPEPSEEGGLWRPVTPRGGRPGGLVRVYELLLESLQTGAEHPMSSAKAFRGLQTIMGIYESARLRRKITFPLEQERFPLELMIEGKYEV